MEYFGLKEGVFLVQGASRGSLLDTNSGKVYSINPSAVAVLTGVQSSAAYWAKLVDMGVAEAKAAPSALPEIPRLPEIRLDFIWFEIITSDCNESCLHCYADSMPPSHRRAKGLPVLEEAGTAGLSYDEWCSLIREGAALGCKDCQFIGGEPLLYRDGKRTVLDLASYAREVGYESIEIFTNGTLLTDEKIARIKELELKIAVSVYSDDPAVHDAVTQTPGSHAKTMQALRKLRAADIPVRVGFVAMRKNEQTIQSTIEFIDNLGVPGSHPDPLRPKGRGQNAALLPTPKTIIDYGVMLSPQFFVDKQTLAHYATGHSCLAGKITITENGDVLPCIFSREQVAGNIRREGGIQPVLQNPFLQSIWNTTKDDVLVCQDCEYRYVCFDCRPLSEAAAMGRSDYLHAPYPRCSYNPYTGRWREGLWRMNGDGPVYDDTYADLLQAQSPENSSVHLPIKH